MCLVAVLQKAKCFIREVPGGTLGVLRFIHLLIRSSELVNWPPVM